MKNAPSSLNGTARAPLPDIQQTPDTRGIPLLKAGVRDVHIPLHFLDASGDRQRVHALVSMTVGLDAATKGVNMSRFMDQLALWSRGRDLTLDLREFLRETQSRLGSPTSHAEIRFRWFLDKPAPVTGLAAPMGYDVTLSGGLESVDGVERFELTLALVVAASNCCPCSKAISDFGAHNQRIRIRATLDVNTAAPFQRVPLAAVVAAIEGAASHPVYPLLKRPDEKHVTEGQYTNPKFVEDVVRDAVLALRGLDWLRAATVEAEALESIHEHNAWAHHSEVFGA